MSNFYIPGGECLCDTYYGGYRTRTFSNIFPSYTEFEKQYNENPLKVELPAAFSLERIYYMLYARYGNSHVSFSDENQFIYNVFGLIFQYGQTAAKRAEIQEKIRALGPDELTAGSFAMYNFAANPDTAPTVAAETELNFISTQNTTRYKKSPLEGYANLLSLLETDVIEEFLGKFRRLFIRVLAADYPLTYATEVNN